MLGVMQNRTCMVSCVACNMCQATLSKQYNFYLPLLLYVLVILSSAHVVRSLRQNRPIADLSVTACML